VWTDRIASTLIKPLSKQQFETLGVPDWAELGGLLIENFDLMLIVINIADPNTDNLRASKTCVPKQFD
jgi:hypothetical protein